MAAEAGAADIIEESVQLCRALSDRLARLRDAVDLRAASPRSNESSVPEDTAASRPTHPASHAPEVAQPPALGTVQGVPSTMETAETDATKAGGAVGSRFQRRQRPRLLEEAALDVPVTAPQDSALYNIDAPPHPLSPLRRRGSVSGADGMPRSPAAMGETRETSGASTLRAEAGTLGHAFPGSTLYPGSELRFGAVGRAPAMAQQQHPPQSAVVLLPAAGGLVAVTSPTSHLQRHVIASPQAHRAAANSAARGAGSPAAAADFASFAPAQQQLGQEEVVSVPLEPLSPPMRMAVSAADAASAQMDRLDAAVRHAMAVAAAMRAQLGPVTGPSLAPQAAAPVPRPAPVPAPALSAAEQGYVPSAVAPVYTGLYGAWTRPYAGGGGAAAAEPSVRQPNAGLGASGATRAAHEPSALAAHHLTTVPAVSAETAHVRPSPARPNALALSLLSPPAPTRKTAAHADAAEAAPPPLLGQSNSASRGGSDHGEAAGAASARSHGLDASARTLGSGNLHSGSALLLPRQSSAPALSSSPLTLPGGFAPAADGTDADADADTGRRTLESSREVPAVLASGAPRAAAAPQAVIASGNAGAQAHAIVSGSAGAASQVVTSGDAIAASVRRLPRGNVSSAASGTSAAAAAGGQDTGTLWDTPEHPSHLPRDASAATAAAAADHHGHHDHHDGASIDGDASAASIAADPSQWLLGPSGGSEHQHQAQHQVPQAQAQRHDQLVLAPQPVLRGPSSSASGGTASAAEAAPEAYVDDLDRALEILRRRKAAAQMLSVASAAGPAAPAPGPQQQPQQPQQQPVSLQPQMPLMLSSLASGQETAAGASVRAASDAIMALAAALQRI